MPNPDRFLLAHELPDEFRDFLAGLNEAHQPRDAHERMLVQELADASWAWQRARANDREFWDYMGGHYNRGNAGIAEAMAQEKEARFRTHLRHMAQSERQYYRALAAVERMTRDRGRGKQLPAISSQASAQEVPVLAIDEPAHVGRAALTIIRPTQPSKAPACHRGCVNGPPGRTGNSQTTQPVSISRRFSKNTYTGVRSLSHA